MHTDLLPHHHGEEEHHNIDQIRAQLARIYAKADVETLRIAAIDPEEVCHGRAA